MAIFSAISAGLGIASSISGLFGKKKAERAQEQAAVADAEARRRRAEAGARGSEASAKQAEYNARVALNNQRLAAFMAADERDVAIQAEGNHYLKIAGMIGEARARLGASGFAADYGDAPEIIGDLAGIGDVEARTIRREGEVRALGRQFEARNFDIERHRLLEEAEAFRVERDAFLEEAKGIRVPDTGSSFFSDFLDIASTGASIYSTYQGAFGSSSTPPPSFMPDTSGNFMYAE